MSGMQTPVEKAIWFIESHFSDDITLDDLARVCGLSRFQISRLFTYATGKTVTAYVRGRRLTEAARALADGAPDILALALQAGYGSHEAFSRAFRDQFGLTPAELRARRHLEALALVEPLREDPAVPVHLPPPRLVSLGPLLVAGIRAPLRLRRFCRHPRALAGTPPLPRRNRGPEEQRRLRSGRQHGGSRRQLFLSRRGRVSDLSDLDGNLTAIRLPAQRWAIFPHGGHITTIASTIHAVFARALPAAGLAAGDMPDLLERYGESFNRWTGAGGFEIWVPVK